MATVELTNDTFESTISDADIVIVDFWAPWCGPCKNFGPIYESVSEKHDDIVFAKVNTEDEQELGASFSNQINPHVDDISRKSDFIFRSRDARRASVGRVDRQSARSGYDRSA